MFGCCFWRAAVMEEEQLLSSSPRTPLASCGFQLLALTPTSSSPAALATPPFHPPVMRSGLLRASVHGKMCYHGLIECLIAPVRVLPQSTYCSCCRLQIAYVVLTHKFDIL